MPIIKRFNPDEYVASHVRAIAIKKFPLLTIKNKEATMPLLEAHIDPKHKDIVLGGYGITKKQAKEIIEWMTKAVELIK